MGSKKGIQFYVFLFFLHLKAEFFFFDEMKNYCILKLQIYILYPKLQTRDCNFEESVG